MKTYLLKSLILIVLFALSANLLQAQTFGGGAGTNTNPYIISTSAHLTELATVVNNGNNWSANKYFSLTTDITTPITTVIGNSLANKMFQGTFNGNGYFITLGLTVTNIDNIGLFAILNNATINNLILNGSISFNFNTTNDRLIGALCGGAIGSTVINNCVNNCNITFLNSSTYCEAYIGGLVGASIQNTTTITNCLNTGNISVISNTNYVGGICGYNGNNNIDILYCENYGNLNGISSTGGLSHIGGILGDSYGTSSSCYISITSCRNSGTISASGSSSHYDLGGIVGDNMESGQIINCTNIGTIRAPISTYASAGSIGGICGYVNIMDITNCVNSGLVIGDHVVGGIGGVTSSGGLISYCINTGVVLANTQRGGILGSGSNNTVSNCFYDKQMCRYGGINNVDVNNRAVGRLTSLMLGNALQATLGTTAWSYATNLYPYLDTAAINDVAASPAFLNEVSATDWDRYDSVRHNFTVSTLLGTTWTRDLGRVDIVGSNATIVTTGWDTLYATIAGRTKAIPIKTTEVPSVGFILKTRPDSTGKGHITTPDSNSYNSGQKAIFTATPGYCYHFLKWTDTNGVTKSTNQIDSVILTNDTILVAVFERDSFDLNLTSNPPNIGILTGSGSKECDSKAYYFATSSDICWQFNNWTDLAGNVISTNANDSLIMIKDTSLVANFIQDSFNLVLQTNPVSGGTAVTAGRYACGTKVLLTATPADCYNFLKWTDNHNTLISYNSIDSIVISQDTTLIAHFEQDSLTLTLLKQPTGKGTVAGEGKYFCNQIASITASINEPCWRFVKWTNSSGQLISTDSNYSVTMLRDTTLIAHFELDSFELFLKSNPTNGGTATTAGKYACGSNAIIHATPINDCYLFENWTDDVTKVVVSTNQTDTIIINQNLRLTANFSRISFELKVIPNPPEGGTASGGRIVECGDSAQINAIANSCWKFISWTDSTTGNIIATTASYKIVITKNTTLYANFAIDSLKLTLKSNPINAGNVAGAGTFKCDTIVNISAEPRSDCFEFVNWTDSATGMVYSTKQYDTVLMMNNARTLIANFKTSDTFYLTLFKYPENIQAEVTGASFFSSCDPIATINGTPFLECIHFDYWANSNGDTVFLTSNANITLKGDSTLIAHFKQDTLTLDLLANPQDGGKVNDVAHFNNQYLCGITEYCIATPDSGWKFVNWTLPDGTLYTTNPELDIFLVSDLYLIANFEITNSADSANLTLIPNPTAGGTVKGAGKYEINDLVPIWATPNPGYKFINWTENSPNGKSISNNVAYNYRFTKSITLYANFMASDTANKKYVVTLISNADNIGELYGGGIYDEYETATLIAVPTGTANFAKWTDIAGYTLSQKDTFNIVVTQDTTLIAVFDFETYMLIVEPNSTYAGVTTGSGLYTANSVVSVKAIPNSTNYIFKGWTTEDNPSDTLSRQISYSFNLDSSMTLIGHFVNSTNIEELLASNNIVIYPNPASNKLFVFIDNTNDINNRILGEMKITMCDFLGRELIAIYDNTINTEYFSRSADISDFPQGIYFLKFVLNGQFGLEKIIIVK